jgi:hypothetical protein
MNTKNAGVRLASRLAAILALACACDAPVRAQTSAAAAGPPAARAPANPNDLVLSYLAAWNEHDPARRRDLVARTWTETGTYVDAHRHGEGHDGIDAMIRTAQQRFPGYELHLISSIEAQNGYVRFSWAAGGLPGAPLYLAGTDFFIVAADGRAQAVAGFVDAAPAPR